QTVSVTMVVSPANVELLTNGGLESSAGWTWSNTYYWTNGAFPHSGSGYAFLGQNDGTTGWLYPQIDIPACASGTLSYWVNVTTSETTTTSPWDVLSVDLYDASSNWLRNVGSYSNLNAGASGVYTQQSFDVSELRKQTVFLQFYGSTDGSKP